MPYRNAYSDSLEHHGILGQKWGVRRYQNYDGTLTELGRRRAGYKTIPKGTTFYRTANSGEPIDSKRKYVTDNVEDRDIYSDHYSEIGVDINKNVSDYTYTSIKTMYLAEAEDIVRELGDKKVSELYDPNNTPSWMKENQKLTDEFFEAVMDIPISVLFDAFYRYEQPYKDDVSPQKYTRYLVYKLGKQAATNPEFFEKMSKLGYDIIADLEDEEVYSKSPKIVLNPSETLKLEKEKITNYWE